MKFRRRKLAPVTDIEAFRKGAAANGAYDSGPELSAPTSAGVERPALSVVARHVESAGLPKPETEQEWLGNDPDAKRRAAMDAVWERRFRNAGLEVPSSIAAATIRIDELAQQNAALRRQVESLQTQLDNANARANQDRMSP